MSNPDFSVLVALDVLTTSHRLLAAECFTFGAVRANVFATGWRDGEIQLALDQLVDGGYLSRYDVECLGTVYVAGERHPRLVGCGG